MLMGLFVLISLSAVMIRRNIVHKLVIKNEEKLNCSFFFLKNPTLVPLCVDT